MRQLYLLAALVLFNIQAALAQQELHNANWHFGYHAGLTFLPDPYNPLSLTNSIQNAWEGCASVSDDDGNLLFYTNGLTVWDSSHQVMINGTGLNGHTSSSQGVVIIPITGSGKYYVVTLDGVTGTRKGLYYSKVDVPAGEVTTLNNVLYDHNGTPIDADYDNCSEKMTSTLHSNGKDHWLVTQIGEYVYSYHVNSNGFILESYTIAPVSIPYTPVMNGPGIGQMKISPDTQHIGIAYFNEVVSPQEGAVATGSFDNTTGLVTFDANLITPNDTGGIYGLEFSPKSQYMYFSTMMAVYYSTARMANDTATGKKAVGIYRTETTGKKDNYKLIGSVPVEEKRNAQRMAPPPFEVIPGSGNPPDWGHEMTFQLAINGRIYISNMHWQYNALSIINDPDNYSDPDFQLFSVPVSPGQVAYGLPQLVHKHISSCQQFITLYVPDLHFVPYTHSFMQYIKTNQGYSVNAGQDITLKAGDYVLMEPHTYIKEGSVFVARIGECWIDDRPSGYGQFPGNNNAPMPKYNILDIYPNPTSGYVNISLKDGLINAVTISTMEGKTVYTKSINESTHQANISSFPTGMYILSVRTSKGEIITSKILKQ